MGGTGGSPNGDSWHGGGSTPTQSPKASLRVSGGSGEANMDDGEVGLRGGGDGDQAGLHSSPQVPLG